MPHPPIPFIPESSDGPGSRKMLVTPEHADAWLQLNDANRPRRPWAVTRLAEAITRGEWHYNGDPIRFATSGKMFDGQHRLAAIREAGQAADARVEWGLPDAAMRTVDTGMRRNLADVLTMQGATSGRALAAALVWVHRMEQHTERIYGGGRGAPTADQILALYERHAGVQQSLFAGRTPGIMAMRLTPSMVAALHYAMSYEDPAGASLFFESITDDWAEGYDLGPGDPRLRFKVWFRNKTKSVGSTLPMRRFVLMAHLIKAWQLWRAGETREVLMWRENAPFPRIQAFDDVVANAQGQPLDPPGLERADAGSYTPATG